MARTFKPMRFIVLMALAAFVVCGVVAFFTQRAGHGRSGEERQGYAIGEKAGEEAAPGATLPNDAQLNMMAQARFKQDGSGDRQVWDQGFENGYAAGFQKTHHTP